MVRVPNVAGSIDRRFLINYRVEPDVLVDQLPAPFRPHLVEGHGVIGICVLRLSKLRPKGLPNAFGISTDNAAHRIAVEWDGLERVERGVYIARRDTSSKLTVRLGGRMFPGVHHRADFAFREGSDHYDVDFRSRLDGTRVSMSASLAGGLPSDSVFSSLEEASDFFRSPLGFSPGHRNGTLECLELQCENRSVQPLRVERVASSFFEDSSRFPRDSVTFDSALVMRNLESAWLPRAKLDSAHSSTKVEQAS